MRWLVLALALWFAPFSFANEDTEEEVAMRRPRPCPTCPGGKCPPKRPRPSR